MSSRLARRTSRSVTSSPCWLNSSRTNAVASAVECTNASPSPRPAHLRVARDLARELLGAARGDDRALGEDQDAVGELLRLVEVVGGEQDRRALEVGEPVHEVMELAPGVRVEAGGRLVEEQQLRPADDADRHVQAPPLPTGERGDLLIGELGQADHLEQLVDRDGPRHLGRRVGGEVAAQLGEEAARRPPGVIAPGLQHHAGARPPVLAGPGRVLAEHADLARGAHPEAFEDLDRGRLPGAVGAEQADHLAPAHLELDAVEDVVRAVAHAQLAHGDQRGRRHPGVIAA